MSVHTEITFIFNLLDPKGTWTNLKTNSSYVREKYCHKYDSTSSYNFRELSEYTIQSESTALECSLSANYTHF